MSLKSKQLLVKVAKIMNQETEKISKKEIKDKLNQIKYLADKKHISRNTLRKEIVHLEKNLHGVFALESKLKEKETTEKKEISALKKQVRELKRKMNCSEDSSLRKKVNRLSHLLGEVMAKESMKKEVRLEKVKKHLAKKSSKRVSRISTAPITLKKIDELQDRILALQKSGKYPIEKIHEFQERLTKLEKKIDIQSTLVGDLVEDKPTISQVETPINHQMLFSAKSVSPIIPVSETSKAVSQLEQDIENLPLPPPPKIRKKR